ncbi:bifunctional metallophosphatase/5'-nucleotidase [Pseudalkalibacillus berkeleyi]|uniref:Bifunctional metallophosphatase/5'-nucleotidase n=1 Tax=Pseudalkalibacillus berkeleyi TaxID=1069813 RepID=A0ABS9H3R3_9BACL|nr:bifunctional UDP-sugar hydrolase/5'-nucleotidase [Pseudalkalibacillus berkeleyi]MCF6138554.1 bifunctional metallophosphatase/5'-nucleotidase [Pseudalkalibacillus berkeleyi]
MSNVKLHLYHTNDLHSHLDQWPKIMGFLKQQQQKHDEAKECVVRFDIGDHADRVHPLTEGTEGRGNVELMNEAGFLNATIGNNEGITFSKEQLDTLYQDANFQVILGNLKDDEGNRPHWAKPYDIHELPNGMKIGVIAATAPFRAYYELLNWDVLDPYESIVEFANEIRDQVDILILLSHLGLEADKQLATESTGIDIILGSHTHHVLPDGIHSNEVTIGQAGKFGFHVGHMEIDWNADHRKITHVKAEVMDVRNQQPDEESEMLLKQLTEKAHENLQEVVTVLNQPLELEWFSKSPFTTLLAEAIREWCDSEIGMINAGLLLEPLKEGPVTKGDLHKVCPHPINPCKLLLKGEYLKEMIHHALTNELANLRIKGLGFRGEVIGRMIFDGVETEGRLMDDGEYHVRRILINGEPIEQDRVYSVGTVDMFTFGRLLPSVAYSEEKKYYLPEMLRDVLAWKLKTLER